jgi:hypothetical protein
LLAAAFGHKYHMAINAAVNKKGGVNDLGKLRSGSGAILIRFLPERGSVKPGMFF